ncbi:MAG: ABC transporter substrate-binding protein [Desulfatibacillaceae bacterium]
MLDLKFFVAVLALLAVASLAHGAERRVVVQDATGREVELRTPIKRVVALNTDGIEVLRILGCVHLVVGTSSLAQKEPEFFPEIQGLPNVGKWNDPDAEAIVALRPDLVLCYGHSPGRTLETKVGGLGIQILRMDCYRPSTILDEVWALARVFGRESAARDYMDWARERKEAVRQCVERSGEQAVAYMEAYSDYKASGPGTAMDELCELAGGVNIARATGLQNAEVTTEWVLSCAPEVVVKAGSLKRAYGATSPEEIGGIHARMLARPGWETMPAAKNGRVHVLAAAIGPGPRAAVGLTYMATWFHPKACADLNPEAVHREYLERFQGLPLQGHHVYP